MLPQKCKFSAPAALPPKPPAPRGPPNSEHVLKSSTAEFHCCHAEACSLVAVDGAVPSDSWIGACNLVQGASYKVGESDKIAFIQYLNAFKHNKLKINLKMQSTLLMICAVRTKGGDL